MSSIERTAYPRYPQKRHIDQKEVNRFYTFTDEERLFIHQAAKTDKLKLSMAIQLKTFQKLGYFIELKKIPEEIIRQLRRILKVHYRLSFGYESKKTHYRHRKLIRQFLGVKRWGVQIIDGRSINQGLRQAIQFASETSRSMNNIADIINAVIEHLVQKHFELPSFNTLDRLVRHTRHVVNNRIFSNIHKNLQANNLTGRFNELLECNEVQRTLFNRLKASPKRPSINKMHEFIKHFLWLESLGDLTLYLDTISKVKLEQFSEEAKTLTADELKDISVAKRYTLIASLIMTAQCDAKDALSIMFCRLIGIADKQAKLELTNRLEQAKEETCKIASLLKHIAENAQSTNNELALATNVRHYFLSQGGYDTVINRCDEILIKNGKEHRIYLTDKIQKKRSLLFKLLTVLNLCSSSQDDKLFLAIQFILKNQSRRSENIEAEIDLSFSTQFWINRIQKKVNGKILHNRKELEACVLEATKKHLSSGDLFVKGAKDYADYREQLMQWEECEQYLDVFCDEIGIPNDPDNFLDGLKKWLTETAETVNDNYNNQSSFVINEDNQQPVLKKYDSLSKSDKAETIERIIRERLKEKTILDILSNAHHHTGWAYEFGPISGTEPKLDNAIEKYILTTFGVGTGMGPTQTAQHVRTDISARIISRVNKKHASIKILDKAIKRIVDYSNGFSLISAWGTGERCAADGTFSSIYDDNLISEHHIRYGKKGGMAYHHVADNYLAFFSTFIHCGVWEAIHIIDGLLKNASELSPKIIHSDTQGQSLPVFSLAHLLGIKLMPRIRNWKSLKFYRPSKNTQYKNIDSLFCDAEIDWEFLKTHWKDLMQVVISIKYGRISSSFILSKLNSYNYQNKLYKAFQELGKVIRTQFLLEYISNKELRQTITATTNKVESYNGLSDWVRFASKYLVATNDPDEMEKSIKYNNLITNAIILQNIIDITDICHELKQENYIIAKEDIAGMSPYITSSTKRFGEYILDLNKKPPSVERTKERAVF